MSNESLNEFKNKDEDKATAELHFSIGMSLRNDWKLWTGTSELSKHFRGLGINHPDDMSAIILTSLHRKLNGIEINLSQQIKYYVDFWLESEMSYSGCNKINNRFTHQNTYMKHLN